MARAGIGKKDLKPANIHIQSVDQKTVKNYGTIMVKVTINNQVIDELVYVCDGIDGLYLGVEACKKMGIIPSSFPEPMSTITKVKTSPPAKVLSPLKQGNFVWLKKDIMSKKWDAKGQIIDVGN